MSRNACPVLLIAISAVAFAFADEVVVTDQQIAALVEQLVSPNTAPQVDVPSVKYPAGFDKSAQKKVANAFHQLRKLSPRSFPFLFDQFNDKRYCLTADSGDFERNYTVGELCRDIVSSHLQSDVWDHKSFGSSFRRRPHQPDYLAHHKLFEPKAAKDWWKTRKEKSLLDLQVEVLEWVIDEESKALDEYSEAEREKVRETLKQLKASKTPLEPGFPFSR